jgi:L-lactate dehydrogenase complex protein LldE
MHIGGGLSRLRSGTRTVHLAEILASTEGAEMAILAPEERS